MPACTGGAWGTLADDADPFADVEEGNEEDLLFRKKMSDHTKAINFDVYEDIPVRPRPVHLCLHWMSAWLCC